MSDGMNPGNKLEINANNSNTVVTYELGGRAIGVICGMATLFVAIGVVVGLNMSRQESLEMSLRGNTISTDLAKYNAQEVRIQAEVNKQLMTALACKKMD